MGKNWLDKNNCNKKMCKSCIFREDGNQALLMDERFAEIKRYLSSFESSHECHVTKLTCYGALQFQATIMYRIGIIKEDTVECMLDTAKQILNL